MKYIMLQAIRKLVNGIVGDPKPSSTPIDIRLTLVAKRLQDILIEEGINEV